LSSKIVFRLVKELGKDTPYIAGLIDGEGSIAIGLHERKPGVRFLATIRIGMSHKETIKRIAKVIGTKVTKYTRKRSKIYTDGYERKIHSRRITIYCVQIYKQLDVEQLLLELMPYLITKKRQAELVLEFIKLRRQGGQETLDKQFDIYWKVRKLNVKGKSLYSMDYATLREEVLMTQKSKKKYVRYWKTQLMKDKLLGTDQ